MIDGLANMDDVLCNLDLIIQRTNSDQLKFMTLTRQTNFVNSGRILEELESTLMLEAFMIYGNL